MRLSLVIGVLLIIVVAYLATTLRPRENFVAKVFISQEGKTLLYRVHQPEPIDSNKQYPLFVFLHGSGERGTDNKLQMKFGVHDILEFSMENDDPAIILVPQLPMDQQWVDLPWDTDLTVMPEQPSLSMQLAIELMNDYLAKLPVDRNRIYVTGLSMGGFGAWDMIQRMPHIFAAALPVCGGGDVKLAEKIKHIPVWAFHGEKDEIVKTKLSRDMIAAIKAVGGNPQYTEYQGVAHDSWTKTYADKNVLRWLFTQNKTRQI